MWEPHRDGVSGLRVFAVEPLLPALLLCYKVAGQVGREEGADGDDGDEEGDLGAQPEVADVGERIHASDPRKAFVREGEHRVDPGEEVGRQLRRPEPAAQRPMVSGVVLCCLGR